jgi:putative tricarboxylic transport membrane protein
MFENLAIGFTYTFQWLSILLIFLGVIWGIIGGMIPGINATVAMALILPFTWKLPSHVAIMLLLGVYVGAEYGGSIPAVLIGTPGTNAAACTAIDGYEMTKKGKSGLALGTSLYSSVIGGFIGASLLIVLAIPLASVALAIGPAEYFALAVMGLTIICSLAGKYVLKGILAGIFGIFLSTVGRDFVSGIPRFTFGLTALNEGFALIPVMMGLFAISEVIRQSIEPEKEVTSSIVKNQDPNNKFPTLKDIKGFLPVSIFAGLVGTFVGVLPGIGAATGGFMGYSETKRWFKNTDTFGQGDIRGVAAPEAANNAVTGGAMVPLLALGIPGSNSTVIMLGALMIHNVVPGPLIFERTPEIPYGSFIALFVANIFLLIIGSAVIRIANKITLISRPILLAAIMALVFTGSYSYASEISHVVMALIFGVIGYGMKKFGLPPTATVLGFVLGSIMESNLRRALIIADGSFLGVVINSPITITLLIIAVISVIYTLIRSTKQPN